MKVVRNSVFETNSSSSHSLSLGSDDLNTQPFDNQDTERGYIEVGCGEYGWEIETYTSVYSKISYLITYVDESTDCLSTDVDPRIGLIKQVIKDYSGLDSVFIYGTGYIDHQSMDVPAEIIEGGYETIRQFLFSKDSYFETDNDNH
jgi:hypothetical protein